MPKFPVATKQTIALAIHQLSLDPVLKPIIESYQACAIRPHQNYYRELVESIIGQQLSVKAAASINRRFVELFENKFPSPEQILASSPESLRAVGLSGAKTRYVQDLASHILNGKLEFERFDSMTNEQIMAELTAVKGIGEWTAHMFLMFCMGRLDILPVGDLGIRSGIMKLYELKALPDALTIREIAAKNNWYPYESVASWYVWQSLDNVPKL
jgi:DNA-3-methyladenine glycosylase II